MAAWRGDLDAVDRLEAEVEGLIGQVDDPQMEVTFKTIALEAAIARGRLDEAFSAASEILERVAPGTKQPTPSETPCSPPHCWGMPHDSRR